MSPSESSTLSAQLIVNATPDTEVFVIDHSFQLRKRSVGGFDIPISPGIYKVKFRRGDAISETTRVIESGQRCEIDMPKELQSVASPLQAALVSQPTIATLAPYSAGVIRALPRGSKPSAVRPTTNASLSLSVSPPSENISERAKSLTLLDAKGTQVADLEPLVRGESTSFVSLRAGSYRALLKLDNATSVEQVVVLARGWTTRVALTWASYAPLADVWAPDLANATMLMTTGNPRDVSAETIEYAGLVKAWLRGPQSIIAAAHAERLIATKITDPLFAICVAHVLVRQIEVDRASLTLDSAETRSRRTLIKTITEKLRRLAVSHPDLAALSIWLGSRSSASFTVPPMLASSWAVISRAAAVQPGLVPVNSLASTITEHVISSSLWLQWRSDSIALGDQASKRVLRSALISELRNMGLPSELRTDLTDLEREVYYCVRRSSKSDSSVRVVGLNAMKRVGVPAATFDRALTSVVRKLKS